MPKYAALLRAVNVSGRQVSMTQLREVLTGLGYLDVTTYVQSGNAVFQSNLKPSRISTQIEERLATDLGMDIPVLVLAHRDLARIVDRNPFVDKTDPAKLHVTFLSDPPERGRVAQIGADAYSPDEWSVRDKVVYLHCPNGYGRTKLNNAFWERKLESVATTRNWRTVNKMLELTASG